KEKYQVSKALAKQWIETEQLLPLFEGLDEVNKNHRNDCVKAINDFLYSYGSTETVVCSRFQDYQVLSEKLQLRSAIYLQSLTAEHIDWYLKDTGNKLVGLKTLLKNDPEIEEFAKTPLILSIMSLTYQDYSSEDVLQHLGLSANRHQNLFDNYIERVSLRPNKTCKKYDLDTSKKWLNFIAKNIIKDKRAIFYPEKIQPSWLSNNSQTKIYLIITSLVVGILYFLLGGIIFGISVGITTSNWNLFLKTGVDYGVAIGVGSALSIGLPNRIISSLVFGLCFALHSMIFIQDSNLITAGIIGSSIVVIAWVTRGSFFEINKINSTSLLRCDSKKFKSSFISGFISGLYFSIFIGIITGLGFDINKINSYQLGDLIFILSLVLLCIVITFIYSYIKKLNLIEILIIISGIVTIFMIAAIEWNLELVQSLLIGAFIGLLIGLFLVGIIFGLINGITAGITNEKIEEEKFLTTRTWIDRNRVFYRITSILILWLTVLLILPTNFPDINISVSFYGVFWLVSYLLRNGAFTYIQNLVVRAVLGNRYVPLNYTEFLDYAVDRIFMYKSGRGYLFIHRMLMEHFANMELDK
ncbi:MAG: NACHT domain-containing NTPase, partial [Xenococcus sp. (in: cyanobacteria)]